MASPRWGHLGRHVPIWGKNFLSREDGKYEGPRVEGFLTHWKISKPALGRGGS